MLVRDHLECEGGQSPVVPGDALDGVALQAEAVDGREVERAGKIVHDCIEESLNAGVAICAAAQDRADRPRVCRLPERRDQVLPADLLVGKELGEKLLVHFAGPLDQVAAPVGVGLKHLLRHGFFAPGHAGIFLVVINRTTPDEVDDAPEGILGADGNDERDCVRSQFLLD